MGSQRSKKQAFLQAASFADRLKLVRNEPEGPLAGVPSLDEETEIDEDTSEEVHDELTSGQKMSLSYNPLVRTAMVYGTPWVLTVPHISSESFTVSSDTFVERAKDTQNPFFDETKASPQEVLEVVRLLVSLQEVLPRHLVQTIKVMLQIFTRTGDVFKTPRIQTPKNKRKKS